MDTLFLISAIGTVLIVSTCIFIFGMVFANTDKFRVKNVSVLIHFFAVLVLLAVVIAAYNY